MKKVIRTMAAVAMLFATTTGMATEPKLSTDGTSKSIIFEWETQHENASLKIVDTEGNVVYSDRVNEGDSYLKKFDFTPLGAGAYSLEIENELTEIVYSIVVHKNSVSIQGMNENHKPTFRKKEGRLYLNYLNSDLKDIKIKVTDSFGRVLFEETVEDTFIVAKTFNFKDAFEGEYTVTVNNGEKSYYGTFPVID